MITVAEKFCFKCQQAKPAAAFTPSNSEKDGLMNACKTCKQPSSKTCSSCKKLKLPSDFYRDSTAKTDGLNYRCKECMGGVYRAYRERNKEKRRAYSQRVYWANRETLIAKKCAYNKAHRPQINANRRGRYFGIQNEEYREMIAAQNGLCGICHQPETAQLHGKTKDLAIDHDHVTGTIRGLLCGRCNRALGGFKDSPAILTRAIAYLSEHEAKPEKKLIPFRRVA